MFQTDKNCCFEIKKYLEFELYLQSLDDINNIDYKKIYFNKKAMFLLKEYKFDFSTYFPEQGNIINIFTSKLLHDVEIFMLFKIFKCDFTFVDKDFNNIIHQIISPKNNSHNSNQLKLLEVLDEDDAYLLNQVNNDDLTPLALAIKSNDENCINKIKELYKKFGYDISEDDKSYELHNACRVSDYNKVKLLINENVLETQIENGNYPVHNLLSLEIFQYANKLEEIEKHWNNLLSIYDILKNTNVENNKGETPFFHLCKLRYRIINYNFWDELINRGVDIHKANNKGVTCLMNAVFARNYDLVKKLISLNVDVNLKNFKNETAIFFAVENNDYNMVKLLVDSGAELEVCNNKKETPLLKASKYNYSSLIELLY